MKSAQLALLATLLLPLASACGARSSLFFAESSSAGGGSATSVGSTGGTPSVGSTGGAPNVSSAGGTTPDPCAAVACETPPSECFAPKGTCNEGVCSYPPLDGALCDDGDACTSNDACSNGVCAGTPLPCTTPPPAMCLSEATLQTWTSPGTCSAGTCTYTPVDLQCPIECSGDHCTGLVTADLVSAGAYSTCAITPTGAVKCWGNNNGGQLGNNSTTDSLVPTPVAGLTSGVVAVSTGTAFSCALTATGAVKCWGFNIHGQLGNNSTTESHIPVGVVGLTSGVLAISSGGEHACAVNGAGGVVCWGGNAGGQLGNNSTTDSHVPVPVNGLSSGVVAVSASVHHTCALTGAGGVKCWGKNTSGELGSGFPADSLVPVDVAGLSSDVVRVVASEANTCALTVSGGVKCWGNNYSGQLGNGTTVDSQLPIDVLGLGSGVFGLSAGTAGACAIASTGKVRCWGTNTFGQLGNGFLADSHVPVDVVGLAADVVAIESGSLDTCAVLATGALQCWGWNAVGCLGDGSTTDSPVPVSVVGF